MASVQSSLSGINPDMTSLLRYPADMRSNEEVRPQGFARYSICPDYHQVLSLIQPIHSNSARRLLRNYFVICIGYRSPPLWMYYMSKRRLQHYLKTDVMRKQVQSADAWINLYQW